ncbi:hypothetical protein HDU91_003251 [Kappamyces sp. JEL0680]|nr:hypothetical protein HDU91_003251 [Kappamyces sp. JEL0680]
MSAPIPGLLLPPQGFDAWKLSLYCGYGLIGFIVVLCLSAVHLKWASKHYKYKAGAPEDKQLALKQKLPPRNASVKDAILSLPRTPTRSPSTSSTLYTPTTPRPLAHASSVPSLGRKPRESPTWQRSLDRPLPSARRSDQRQKDLSLSRGYSRRPSDVSSQSSRSVQSLDRFGRTNRSLERPRIQTAARRNRSRSTDRSSDESSNGTLSRSLDRPRRNLTKERPPVSRSATAPSPSSVQVPSRQSSIYTAPSSQSSSNKVYQLQQIVIPANTTMPRNGRLQELKTSTRKNSAVAEDGTLPSLSRTGMLDILKRRDHSPTTRDLERGQVSRPQKTRSIFESLRNSFQTRSPAAEDLLDKVYEGQLDQYPEM